MRISRPSVAQADKRRSGDVNMGKTVNEDLDERLYNIFWRKLQQAKYDLIYYSIHFNECVSISRRIKYAIIGTTTLATGAWMTWSNTNIVAKICPIVILALQVVSAISEKFPYESRKLELREMIAELEPLYLEMENDWRSIRNLEKANSKIQEAIQNYDTKQAEIKRHYFKEDSLPESDKIRLKADEKTEEYFKYFE